MDSPLNVSVNTSSLGMGRKMRRQTATFGISYAKKYPDQLKKTTLHLGGHSCEDSSTTCDDNWSESISESVDRGSLESIDRLSPLSEFERESAETDQESKLSRSFSKNESAINLVDFAQKISTLAETYIEAGNLNNNNSILISNNSETSTDKEFTLLPVISIEEIDPLELEVTEMPPQEDPHPIDLDFDDEDGDMDDCDRSKQSLSSTHLACVSLSGSERYVASAPVTPFGGGAEKKKHKNSSPAVSLLEKSASWFSSLSSGPKKVKKSSTFKSAKKSLTSLFEAVASTTHLGSPSQPLNIHHSQTLPNQLHQRIEADGKSVRNHTHARPDEVIMSEESRSGSTLSLTGLDRTFPAHPSINHSQRSSRKSNRLSPVANPSGYHTIDSHRLPTSKHSRSSLEDKKLLQCVKQFNLDPKRGIELLEFHGFLDAGNPERVANFLFTEARLSKKQIGAYIGAHYDFNKLVLRSFVGQHKFMDLILVQALRQFLWSFRLPGEAMQIDRIMESFAAHYCNQNPGLFDETDTCYILSFSIIMLNTALHNPNVRQKITLEQFVSQNRGINSGKDLSKEVLEKIYRSIKEEPFEIPNESYDDLMYTFFSPEKEGWLFKEGGNWKNWKRRWFVLSDRCLYYFQHTAENVPKGIIPLENVKVRLIEDNNRKFSFELYSESNSVVKGCKTDSNGTVVQGHHKSYKMSASSEEERISWINTIRESIKDHPFYDLINSKKAALRRKSLKHIQQHDLPLPSTPQQCILNSTGEPTTLSYTLQT